MHSKLALEGGLAKGTVEAIAANAEPGNLSDGEKAVYTFCREVHATGRAGDATFAAIEKRFGLDGALELIALNGYYTLMAMVLNNAGLPLPGGVAPPLETL
jgi:4-carboxymuconolactone decarboxylase